MAWELGAGGRVTDFQELPTPGAVQYWQLEWVPTLDGEPILWGHTPTRFPTRDEAWAEAIKRVKHHAGLAFEIALGGSQGCVLHEVAVIVETVAEAREAIVRHAMPAGESDEAGPVWEDLAGYEDSRRYDPGNPEAGMTCSYSLSETEWMEGVGGTLWPVSDHRWATAPPEVWDHPADKPIGLDTDDDLHNDYRPDSATSESSELESD